MERLPGVSDVSHFDPDLLGAPRPDSVEQPARCGRTEADRWWLVAAETLPVSFRRGEGPGDL